MPRTRIIISIVCLLYFAPVVVYAGENTNDFYRDSFTVGVYEVFVKFYEPLDLLKLKFPDFDFNSASVSEDQKLRVWVDCLHLSTVYLFTVKDKQGNIEKHFCMRGNPGIRNSARFYMVEVVSGNVPAPFDPNGRDYGRWVERTINNFSAGDVLFEHMSFFQSQSNNKYVGNGIKFFGKYFRVTPYEEVRKAMTLIMKEELQAK